MWPAPVGASPPARASPLARPARIRYAPAMRFSEIAHQEAALEQIRATLAAGRIPHAWLLHGPRGVGKTTAALAMARLLQCRAPVDGAPCENCPACRQSAHFNHPDIHIVPPTPSAPDTAAGEGQRTDFIAATLDSWRKEPIFHLDESRPLEHRIRTMRWVKQEASRAVVVGPWKIFILKTAGAMNNESANAILKLLEEPTPGTLLLLGVENPAALPATIPSRCALIRFRPLPVEAVAQLLVARVKAEPAAAALAARLSGGSVTRAARFLEEEILPVRDEALALLASGPNAAGRPDPERHGQIDAWLKARERTRLFLLLDLLRLWFRDLLRVRVGAVDPVEGLANADRADELARQAARLSEAQIAESIRLVEETRAALDGYGYAPLVLYSLLERLPAGNTTPTPAAR